MKRTLKERVDDFIDKNKPMDLFSDDMQEIFELGDMYDIIKYAYFFGYMCSVNKKKGGAV